ncbi:MAG: aspartate aminotransferase family protein [Armatimonadetes bacterium]|nr:aspartate aminotransferase family protein [Armatimonadota bacterium]
MLYDFKGKEYIDAHSILWVANIGHGRKEIALSCQEQMEKLAYGSLFGGYFNEPAIKLALKLKEIAPAKLQGVFFTSGGSEAVESAIKIARQYHQRKGQLSRVKIISRRESYHGVTWGALSATGLRIYRTPFEPLVPGFLHISPPYCYRCDFGKTYPECKIECAETLEQLIRYEGPKTIAAFIGEPVMSAAGALVAPLEYWNKIQEICRNYGILLIIDEVINAFGRCGYMFASNHYKIKPDLITLAKALTGGYAPMGAVLINKEIMECFQDWMFVHGLTFGGHPVSAIAALKNIEVLEKEKLISKAKDLGKYLLEGLENLKKHKIIGDIRGIGMHTAIEYVKDKKTKEKIKTNLAAKIEESAWKKGIYLCRASIDKTYIAPPLIITKEQINKIIDVLDESIEKAVKDI